LSASHTGNVNDLYNSITNKVPSVVNGFTYAIRNQSRKYNIIWQNYNYYFDETASLAVQYSFQFNKRLEFDVRRGISMRLLLRFSVDNECSKYRL
jgi:iron complex outermembrane receptor protein